MSTKLFILFAYSFLLIAITLFSSKKQKTGAEFILGNRSLNFWLTALSAQASDMSSWLFLAYPALVFGQGIFAAWTAIGLAIGMYLNWHFIAPRLRQKTEQLGSLTLSSYFENRFQDRSGGLRLISGIMSVLFFTLYIASGLVATGILFQSLFHLPYSAGITIGLAIAVTYVLLGGYRTVAWIDLFQGFFLLGVIVFVPCYLLHQIGGISPIMQAAATQKLSTSLFPDFQPLTFWKIFVIAAGWGLGYFGQPHILTKFMGIRHTSEMRKAKYLGMSWLIVALTAATCIGMIGIFLFPQGLHDPQQVILEIVKSTLAPFFAGLVLCAILAATTNVMAAHVLIVASNLADDFYKRFFHINATPEKLLKVSRWSVVFVACVGLIIAFFKISSIYTLVFYSWSGLGASFGPLVILSLYSKRVNRYGAFAGIFTGGLTAAIWPYFNHLYGWDIASIIPGFFLSFIAIQAVSFLSQKRLNPMLE